MAAIYPEAMRRLINELTKLPSIGERSAARLAYYLLTSRRNEMKDLAHCIIEASEKTVLCPICYFFSDNELCTICSDQRRDRALLCVVEKPADVIALEQSGGYRGLYHVLHGVWSPLRGISPQQTKIVDLVKRLTGPRDPKDPLVETLSELILATGTTVEGDATALYIAESLAQSSIKISRIAQGLPKGGELEYADQLTLTSAIDGRREI